MLIIKLFSKVKKSIDYQQKRNAELDGKLEQLEKHSIRIVQRKCEGLVASRPLTFLIKLLELNEYKNIATLQIESIEKINSQQQMLTQRIIQETTKLKHEQRLKTKQYLKIVNQLNNIKKFFTENVSQSVFNDPENVVELVNESIAKILLEELLNAINDEINLLSNKAVFKA
ncbi:hypothetical protein GJ496_010964 [Pomphorhynchus laevis]|nr:hypothetical protein GJ496_010964 [Pomphorhynchus laevis]